MKKLHLAAMALAAALVLPAQAQTEIQWWHSMTAVNGEWVNDLAKNFNASQPGRLQDCAYLQRHL